ncbi:Hsp20/alpha crystallin family protein [Persicitalea jodogahamensis]|uniref:Heat-shock protein n=1 Tax=Persicitalea jodogahamensis TaxID=402147 RepID=A0A8J3D259_9BACT|nr:Hsp20/alpha crystallin family protein [Persicitalea jodogahamensis]GHB68153.1 heat-shock protein [Persicitalea jodogahamensis]
MNALIRNRNNDSYQYPSLINSFFSKDLMDELFTPTFNGTAPAVNVREDEDGYYIEVAAPGLSKSDFKLNLDHNRLTISAEKRQEDEFDNYEDHGNKNGEEQKVNGEAQKPNRKKGKYTRREFSYSSFQRTFTLPNTVDGEKINATYTDGVLNVDLPKREEAKVKPSRTIEIS